MTDIVKGMYSAYQKSDSATNEGAMRAALLWFAERLEAEDDICDPVGDAFWRSMDPFYKSGRQTLLALAAAIRAAAGETANE